MSKVLITGARAPIALELARSFYKAGHDVIMADSLRFTLARWTNSILKYYTLPSPRFEFLEFEKKLMNIVQKEQITDIIPTCEESFYISLLKPKLKCKVWTSDIDLMNQLHNKYLFSQFAGSYFQIPETKLIEDFIDWENSESYVFKAIFSRFNTSTIIGKKVNKSFFGLNDQTKWIAQKRIYGKEICVYSIWDDGILRAISLYHPLYRAGKGSGIFFESVSNNDIFELVRSFGTKVKYTGQLSFDVIVDENNIPYFIECNPRGTSGAHLIHEKLADSFTKNNTFVMNANQDYSIKFALGLMNPFSFFTTKIKKSKDVIFNSKDKMPFFLQILSLIEITIIMFFKRLSWIKATTNDIEWNAYEG